MDVNAEFVMRIAGRVAIFGEYRQPRRDRPPIPDMPKVL
jgi:hypothetical protein